MLARSLFVAWLPEQPAACSCVHSRCRCCYACKWDDIFEMGAPGDFTMTTYPHSSDYGARLWPYRIQFLEWLSLSHACPFRVRPLLRGKLGDGRVCPWDPSQKRSPPSARKPFGPRVSDRVMKKAPAAWPQSRWVPWDSSFLIRLSDFKGGSGPLRLATA